MMEYHITSFYFPSLNYYFKHNFFFVEKFNEKNLPKRKKKPAKGAMKKIETHIVSYNCLIYSTKKKLSSILLCFFLVFPKLVLPVAPDTDYSWLT